MQLSLCLTCDSSLSVTCMPVLILLLTSILSLPFSFLPPFAVLCCESRCTEESFPVMTDSNDSIRPIKLLCLHSSQYLSQKSCLSLNKNENKGHSLDPAEGSLWVRDQCSGSALENTAGCDRS